MLIFVILLYFGLKIMSLSAYTAGDGPLTHICIDYSTQTNATTVKWGVSVPLNISGCELFCHKVNDAEPGNDVLNDLPSHGTFYIREPQRSTVWTVRVSCSAEENGHAISHQSPYVKFIPGNASLSHVCSDSNLGSMVSVGSEIPLVLCIWRPEPHMNYAVVRWQPTIPLPGVRCTLHKEIGGRTINESGLPPDDMQSFALDDSGVSAWLTCYDQHTKAVYISGKAEYMQAGAGSVCSVQHSVQSTQTSDSIPTDPPIRGRLGITNIGTGLALAAGMLLVALILTTVFVKWYRWQQRRRRQRLLRNGEPANDQGAMEEFQQMM